MSFQRGTNDLPRIDNYEQARAFLEKTKPIRNSNVIPVSSRRVRDVQIYPSGGAVVIRYHHTEVLTYLPDGEILISTGGYTTPSTHNVLEAVLGCRIASGVGETWISCKAAFQNGENGYLSLNQNSRFRFEGWDLIALEPVYPTIYVMDKQKANAVRKHYKDFTRFAESFMKLRGASMEEGKPFAIDAMRGEGAPHRYSLARSNTRERAQEILQGATDPDQYIRTLAEVLCVEWGTRETIVSDIKEFRRLFTYVMQHAHGHEFISRQELRTGKLIDRQHRKYAELI